MAVLRPAPLKINGEQAYQRVQIARHRGVK
jgi:hypothetical protein